MAFKNLTLRRVRRGLSEGVCGTASLGASALVPGVHLREHTNIYFGRTGRNVGYVIKS